MRDVLGESLKKLKWIKIRKSRMSAILVLLSFVVTLNVFWTMRQTGLALAGDAIAANHYTKLRVKADACLHCGHCESRCPFGVKQESRMDATCRYFTK